LIADRVVELGILDHISATSVATVLKKTSSSPGVSKSGSSHRGKVRSSSTAWSRS
jgi:hypothetical protein